MYDSAKDLAPESRKASAHHKLYPKHGTLKSEKAECLEFLKSNFPYKPETLL